MKKLLLGIIVGLSLSGGFLYAAQNPFEGWIFSTEYGGGAYILKDKETGCQYILTEETRRLSSGGITPRLGSNGQPLCTKRR